MSANGAFFYSDEGYRGNRFCMDANERRDYVGDYNDRISSVRIYGRARVTLYEHSNFGGDTRNVNGDMPELPGFNDKASSIVVR